MFKIQHPWLFNSKDQSFNQAYLKQFSIFGHALNLNLPCPTNDDFFIKQAEETYFDEPGLESFYFYERGINTQNKQDISLELFEHRLFSGGITPNEAQEIDGKEGNIIARTRYFCSDYPVKIGLNEENWFVDVHVFRNQQHGDLRQAHNLQAARLQFYKTITHKSYNNQSTFNALNWQQISSHDSTWQSCELHQLRDDGTAFMLGKEFMVAIGAGHFISANVYRMNESDNNDMELAFRAFMKNVMQPALQTFETGQLALPNAALLIKDDSLVNAWQTANQQSLDNDQKQNLPTQRPDLKWAYGDESLNPLIDLNDSSEDENEDKDERVNIFEDEDLTLKDRLRKLPIALYLLLMLALFSSYAFGIYSVIIWLADHYEVGIYYVLAFIFVLPTLKDLLQKRCQSMAYDLKN